MQKVFNDDYYDVGDFDAGGERNFVKRPHVQEDDYDQDGTLKKPVWVSFLCDTRMFD